MKTRRKLLGAAALVAVILAGCSTGPPIHATIGAGSPLCQDLSSLSIQLDAIKDAANAPASQLVQELQPVSDTLTKAQKDAPSGDTVGGHPVKSDLGVELTAYQAVLSALQSAANGNTSVANALAPIQASQGDALTGATGRLDAYAQQVCKVSVPATTTTGAPAATTTTSVAPAGPVAPTTTS